MQILKGFIDILLPPRCPSCGQPVEDVHKLCLDCWSQIRFISDPLCDCCGLPFEVDEQDTALCGPCLHELPHFDHHRSSFVYDDSSRSIILKFKHADRIDARPFLTDLLLAKVSPWQSQIDYVVPVPLHWTRLFKRRYNQAALLAQALAKRIDKTYAPFALKRIKPTPPQGHMNITKRRKNVEKAFATGQDVQGKTILLIDDVYTTGATLNACARILKEAGATKILCLTVARVVKAS